MKSFSRLIFSFATFSAIPQPSCRGFSTGGHGLLRSLCFRPALASSAPWSLCRAPPDFVDGDFNNLRRASQQKNTQQALDLLGGSSEAILRGRVGVSPAQVQNRTQ